MKNEDLLRELIDAAHDSGYDAAVMEKAAEWATAYPTGLLLSAGAELLWQQHLSKVVERREALRAEVLARMGIGGVKEFSDDLAGVAREALHVEEGDE